MGGALGLGGVVEMVGQSACIARHRFPHHMPAIDAAPDPEHVGQEASDLREPGPDFLDCLGGMESSWVANRHPADRDSLPGWDLTAYVHRTANATLLARPITAPLNTIAPVAMKT